MSVVRQGQIVSCSLFKICIGVDPREIVLNSIVLRYSERRHCMDDAKLIGTFTKGREFFASHLSTSMLQFVLECFGVQ